MAVKRKRAKSLKKERYAKRKNLRWQLHGIYTFKNAITGEKIKLNAWSNTFDDLHDKKDFYNDTKNSALGNFFRKVGEDVGSPPTFEDRSRLEFDKWIVLKHRHMVYKWQYIVS